MPTRNSARTRRPQRASGQPSPASVVRILQGGGQSILERYQRYRRGLSLEKRLAELIWSPEAMLWPVVPIPALGGPDAGGRWVLQEVGPDYWRRRQMGLQRKYGDGHWSWRGKLQEEALAACEAVVREPLERALTRAENSNRDQEQALDELRATINAKVSLLKEQICRVGEQFRDEWVLCLQDGKILDWARDDFRPRVRSLSEWSGALREHAHFAEEQLSSAVEPEAEEYLALLRCLRGLWPQVRGLLNPEAFFKLLPPTARYRRPGRGGRPRPPVTDARKALSALKPRLPRLAIEKLFTAWCLKEIPPAER